MMMMEKMKSPLSSQDDSGLSARVGSAGDCDAFIAEVSDDLESPA